MQDYWTKKQDQLMSLTLDNREENSTFINNYVILSRLCKQIDILPNTINEKTTYYLLFSIANYFFLPI